MQKQNNPIIKSVEHFLDFVEIFWANRSKKPIAYGIGLAYRDSNRKHIATRWFSAVKTNEKNMGTLAVLLHVLNSKSFNLETIEEMLSKYFHVFENDGQIHTNIEALKQVKLLVCKERTPIVRCFYKESDLTNKLSQDIGNAHFRLALTLNEQGTASTEGVLGILPSLVWTSEAVFTEGDWKQVENKEAYGKVTEGKFPPPHWNRVLSTKFA